MISNCIIEVEKITKEFVDHTIQSIKNGHFSDHQFNKIMEEIVLIKTTASIDKDAYYQNELELAIYPVYDTPAKCVLWFNIPYEKTLKTFESLQRIIIINSVEYAKLKEQEVRQRKIKHKANKWQNMSDAEDEDMPVVVVANINSSKIKMI